MFKKQNIPLEVESNLLSIEGKMGYDINNKKLSWEAGWHPIVAVNSSIPLHSQVDLNLQAYSSPLIGPQHIGDKIHDIFEITNAHLDEPFIFTSAISYQPPSEKNMSIGYTLNPREIDESFMFINAFMPKGFFVNMRSNLKKSLTVQVQKTF